MPSHLIAEPVAAACASRSFPAAADQVRETRRYLAGVMAGSPVLDDAVACVSELAANSVLHSASGRSGSTFAVRIDRFPDRWRIAVEDAGGPWLDRRNGDGSQGRGLAIVAALSSRFRIDGDAVTHRTVWFEIDIPTA